MRSAKEWSDIFCNRHIISVRGNVMEEFIKEIQDDARENKESEQTKRTEDQIDLTNALFKHSSKV